MEQGKGFDLGTSCTTDDVTLGGGVKALAGTSKRIFVWHRQFDKTAKRP